jgi:uncharacterized membrane protein YqjE
MSPVRFPRISRQTFTGENIALSIAEHPLISSLVFLSLWFLIFIWLGWFVQIWGLAGVTLFTFIILLVAAVAIYWYYRKKRREKLISKAISVLRKREEVNYRNLDSRNIIDAFEKAPGVFYPSYREVPEEILTEIKDGKIEKISGAASRLIEKLTEMTAQKFVDVRTGMTSFFVVRTEDELVEEAALDQIVTHVKRIAGMMHSVKSQVVDVPIWRLNEKMERRIGLLFLISGVDIPLKIKEDVKIAKEQDRIISDMELMKAVKQAAYDLQEGRRDEYEKALSRIAFRAHRRMESARKREDIKE